MTIKKKPVVRKVKPADVRKPMKISESIRQHARMKAPDISVERLFALPSHPPGVEKPRTAMAQDITFGDISQWTTSAYVASGGGFLGMEAFLGYPYLAQLAARPEYRVISETIASEMTRKWIEIKATGEDEEDDTEKEDKVKQIVAEFKRLKVREAFKRAAELDGYFGRAHIALVFVGDDDTKRANGIGNGWDDVSKATVEAGKLERLKVIEPVWVYGQNYNMTDPLADDFYRPNAWLVFGQRLDASRVLTFIGREVSDLLKPAYSFGGVSLSQLAKTYVDKWLTTTKSVNDLIRNFAVSVLKTNMSDALGGEASQSIFARAELLTNIRDNNGVLLMDKEEEEFGVVTTPLSGLDQLQAQAQEHMSSVSQIPLVKLTGISPSGLNASSEGEIQVFNDSIHARQEAMFAEHLHQLLGFVQLSLFGEVDDEITIEFLPLHEMNAKEQAEIGLIEAQTDQIDIDAGVIAPQDRRQKVSNDPDSPYAGLDPEDMPNLKEEEQEGLKPSGGSGSADDDSSPINWHKALKKSRG